MIGVQRGVQICSGKVKLVKNELVDKFGVFRRMIRARKDERKVPDLAPDQAKYLKLYVQICTGSSKTDQIEILVAILEPKLGKALLRPVISMGKRPKGVVIWSLTFNHWTLQLMLHNKTAMHRKYINNVFD